MARCRAGSRFTPGRVHFLIGKFATNTLADALAVTDDTTAIAIATDTIAAAIADTIAAAIADTIAHAALARLRHRRRRRHRLGHLRHRRPRFAADAVAIAALTLAADTIAALCPPALAR